MRGGLSMRQWSLHAAAVTLIAAAGCTRLLGVTDYEKVDCVGASCVDASDSVTTDSGRADLEPERFATPEVAGDGPFVDDRSVDADVDVEVATPREDVSSDATLDVPLGMLDGSHLRDAPVLADRTDEFPPLPADGAKPPGT